MEFLILNEALEALAVLDQFKSAIWTRRYFSAGDFEIYAPATESLLELLKHGRIIARTDKPEQAGIIESLRITTSAEEGNYIIASGRLLQGMLARRIVWKQATFTGSPENVMRRIVTQAAINPEEAGRAIPGLELAPAINEAGLMKIQFTGDNIAQAIEGICRTYGLGYSVDLDRENGRFLFRIYKGADRSYNQNTNPFVVFSNDFENLLSTEYTNDTTEAANVAQVAGEGEGTARRKIIVGGGEGLARKETFINASQLSTNDGEFTADVYGNVLAQKGAEALAELKPVEAMESEVAHNYGFILDRDYFLGDIVEIIDEYGHALTPRVVEIIESQDETGYTCIPTFSTNDNEA